MPSGLEGRSAYAASSCIHRPIIRPGAGARGTHGCSRHGVAGGAVLGVRRADSRPARQRRAGAHIQGKVANARGRMHRHREAARALTHAAARRRPVGLGAAAGAARGARRAPRSRPCASATGCWRPVRARARNQLHLTQACARAPTAQCGWCGAINDHSPAAGSGGGARPRAPGRARRALRALAGPARWLVVAFVVLLMGAVTSVGLCIVLPRAFPNPLVCLLHSTFALMLLTATVSRASGLRSSDRNRI